MIVCFRQRCKKSRTRLTTYVKPGSQITTALHIHLPTVTVPTSSPNKYRQQPPVQSRTSKHAHLLCHIQNTHAGFIDDTLGEKDERDRRATLHFPSSNGYHTLYAFTMKGPNCGCHVHKGDLFITESLRSSQQDLNVQCLITHTIMWYNRLCEPKHSGT